MAISGGNAHSKASVLSHYITHMDRLFFSAGALFAGLAVAAGAFGTHTLRNRVEPRLLEVFETAARYQMYHALALIAVAWAAFHGHPRAGRDHTVGWSVLDCSVGVVGHCCTEGVIVHRHSRTLAAVQISEPIESP